MWCVKDDVSKMVGDKVVFERWCVTNFCVKDVCQSAPKRATRASPVPYVPRLPRKTKADVGATPAT